MKPEVPKEGFWVKAGTVLGAFVLVFTYLGFAFAAHWPPFHVEPTPSPSPTAQPVSTQQPGPPDGLLADLPVVNGDSVDGIPCEASEQREVHVHSHVAIFAQGSEVGIPAG